MEWDEEAAKWVTFVPLLNNISTFGSTQTEALHHTREMILAYVESMSEDDLPLPLTHQEVKSLLTAKEKMPFEVTPVMLYLTRLPEATTAARAP